MPLETTVRNVAVLYCDAVGCVQYEQSISSFTMLDAVRMVLVYARGKGWSITITDMGVYIAYCSEHVPCSTDIIQGP